MSNVSHVSTVDRGLKMKIKRTKVGLAKSEPKHEVVKGEGTSGTSTPPSAGAASTTGVHLVNGVSISGSTVSGSANSDSKSAGGVVFTSAGGTPNKAGSGSAATCLAESCKDKSPKVKTPYAKKDKCKEKSASTGVRPATDGALSCSGTSNTTGGSNSSGGVGVGGGGASVSGGLGLGVSSGLDLLFSQVSMEPRVAVEAVTVRREVARPVLDPYEFNAKVEDGIGLPPKKLKTDTKVETASSPLLPPSNQDAATETCSIGVVTEPECLGPCEPGTSVTLEGIVWQETDNGVLVINVTWRGKTYVGTLLDATKHDWAPPRPNCESPVSDFETQLPKGRAKRGRANAGTPVGDRTVTEGRKLRKGRRGSNANFQAPPSPARSDTSNAGVKRKGRPVEDSIDLIRGDKGNNNKRSRSCSRGGASGTESPTPSVIECPEPNCNKKYKHINGLRYHQTHAHHHPVPVPDDEKEEEEDMETDSKDSKKNSDAEGRDSKKEALSERAERMKAKEQRRREKEREKSLEKDCSSLEDNIPLKAFANRVVAQNSDKGRSETMASKVDSSKFEPSGSNVTAASASVTSSIATSASAPPTAILSKKKDAGSVSVGMPVAKTSSAGQVYQISGVGCLGGMAVMAPTSTVQASVVTPTITVTACPTVPSTTSIPLTVSSLVAPEMGKGESKEGNKATDKGKSKISTRPIVPALSPQMMALNSASQSTVVPNPGHSQLSSSLKMIQPKPTIMGEYSNLNPALADLKEKRSKSKKKKEKDGVHSSGQTSGQISKSGNKDDPAHLEHVGVVKSVASCPLGRQSIEVTTRKDNIPSIEVSKPADSPRTGVSSSAPMPSPVTSPQLTLKAQDQVRTVQPPALLKVNSPLHVSASERKTPVSDDVQSPAYSDISDANDSSSPQQQDSPKKESETAHKKDATSAGPPSAGEGSGGVAHYGMYYYSRPSPYMSPNVSTTPHSSPNSTKSSSMKKDEVTRPEDNRLAQTPEEARKGGGDKESSIPVGPPGAKPEGLERAGPSSMATSPPQQQQQAQHPQQQIQEYQQKWLQQFYSQIRMLPQQAQYQYLAAYGMLDPFHQMHFINQQDPQYRQMMEKASEEQKRLQEQGGGKKKAEGDAGKKLPGSRPPSADQGSSQADPGGGSSQKISQPHYGSQAAGVDRHFEAKSLGESADERDMREQALREKQNENHQIMKENIELKYQMERRQKAYEHEQERMKHEELRRMQLYQQQKDQRPPDKRKIEVPSKPPELNTSVKGHGMETSSRLTIVKPEDIKKEPMDHSRVKEIPSRPQDSKGGDEKRQGEKGRGGPSDSHGKSKPQDLSSSSSSAMTVVASSGPSGAQSGPSGQFLPYSYPGVYPHYAPVQVDPTHPVYRSMNPHVIGYAAAPPGAYLHPSQLGYRMGPVDSDKESSKQESKIPVPPLSAEDSSKGASENLGSQFYGGPVHKIHELQEKARPRPASTSPAPPGKSAEPSQLGLATLSEKQREYTKSPPTQRHLHTHHHTHVLSHGFPLAYADPYSAAMFATAPHGAPPPSSSLQPSFNKP